MEYSPAESFRSSQYFRELLVITKDSSLLGHHEMLCSAVENAINGERGWVPLAEARLADLPSRRHRGAPEEQKLELFSSFASTAQALEVQRGCDVNTSTARLELPTSQLHSRTFTTATNVTSEYDN